MEEIEVIVCQDGDCHWYWIPKTEKQEFDDIEEKTSGIDYMENPDLFEEFISKFEKYATGGSPDLEPNFFKENKLKPIKL